MNKYLKINNLSYAYPDGYEALKGIDFSINQGESIAILGPNGAGKTTLILHLNGIPVSYTHLTLPTIYSV